MALPLLAKLLPAAQLAYQHRDKASDLFNKVKQWRNSEFSESLSAPLDTEYISGEEELAALKIRLIQQNKIIVEQSDIIAALAKDTSELSSLTNKLRKRSQHMLISILALSAITLIMLLKN